MNRQTVAHPAVLHEGRALVGHRVLPAGRIEQHFERLPLEEVQLMVGRIRRLDRRLETAELDSRPSRRGGRRGSRRRSSSRRRRPLALPERSQKRRRRARERVGRRLEARRRLGIHPVDARRPEGALQVVALEADEQARRGHPVVPERESRFETGSFCWSAVVSSGRSALNPELNRFFCCMLKNADALCADLLTCQFTFPVGYHRNVRSIGNVPSALRVPVTKRSIS